MTPAAQREQPAVAATTAAEGTLKGYPALGTCWTLGKKRGPVGNLGVPAIPSFLHSFDKWAPRPWSVPTSAPGIWDSWTSSRKGPPPTWSSRAVGGRRAGERQ